MGNTSELKVLLAPQTHLRLDLAAFLLAAFDKIVLLQPTEAPPEGHFSELVNKGLVEIIVPCPLGEEKLTWFNRLIASYEEWGQMMRWPENVAMFKVRPEVLEETVSEIKAQILGEEKNKPDPDLQARIILQLAQNLDRRLEELDFEYQDLKAHAERLSSFIVGQDPTLRRFPDWVIEGQEISVELPNVKERMLAFAHLIAKFTELPLENIVSDQPELIETFLDLCPEYKKLGIISLPAVELDLEMEDIKDTKEKINSILSGKSIEEKEIPCLEVFQLKASPQSLFLALKKGYEALREGKTNLFYLRRG
ncbi:hypothetical protein [Thermodesulfatator autotrophicus]|uniref:Uncharacterized protein n=1 Tax=Thermodesulfatator autotrophicus TaxID=1795632 RepID=A0A177E6M3_9BACT|nr:hypothetical protein [Thermodesulfatator autotrophicus]OAG27594.1 hypothetical protein TH606_06035 [Thermodesulfatator autotrophicus]